MTFRVKMMQGYKIKWVLKPLMVKRPTEATGEPGPSIFQWTFSCKILKGLSLKAQGDFLWALEPSEATEVD